MYKLISSHFTLILDIVVILYSPFALWKFTDSVFFSDSSPFIGYKVSDLLVRDLFTILIFTAIVLFVYHFVFIHFVDSVSSVFSFVINRKGNR